MKLWQFVLLLVLLGGAGVVIAQEVRYRDQLAEAAALADTAALLRTELDVTVTELGERDAELATVRADREESERAAAETISELERELEGQREVTELVEGALRDHLAEDTEGTVMVDDLVAGHAQELAATREVTEVVRRELDQERRLRVVVDSTLFATRAALADCLCTLEAAETALGAFQDVTDGRGWASRAWDSVTSPKGLLTLAVVGLAAYGTYQLVTDDGGDVNVYGQDWDPQPMVSLAVPWPGGR